MFKHIVIEGGAYFGLYIIGAIYELKKSTLIDNIESIYGVSVGSYIGLLLCLKMDWDDILNYFINRPWNKTFTLPNNIKKGLLDQSFFKISLENLLLSKDLSLDTTFIELYNHCMIDFHVFVTELKSMNQIDLSYKTHPTMKIIEAISQSCSMPYIFKPVLYNDKYYLDGGIINNFPLQYCINNGAKNEEILGFRFNKTEKKELKDINNIISFGKFFQDTLIKYIRKINVCNEKIETIYFEKTDYNIEELFLLFNSSEHRQKYIDYGRNIANEFLNRENNR